MGGIGRAPLKSVLSRPQNERAGSGNRADVHGSLNWMKCQAMREQKAVLPGHVCYRLSPKQGVLAVKVFFNTNLNHRHSPAQFRVLPQEYH
jgi:hypothetical protein